MGPTRGAFSGLDARVAFLTFRPALTHSSLSFSRCLSPAACSPCFVVSFGSFIHRPGCVAANGKTLRSKRHETEPSLTHNPRGQQNVLQHFGPFFGSGSGRPKDLRYPATENSTRICETQKGWRISLLTQLYPSRTFWCCRPTNSYESAEGQSNRLSPP